jgi:FAD/FMN-containing dehydrogenase
MPTTTHTLPTESQFDELRNRLAGELITADSVLFENARLVQDFSVDRRPLAIVRAANDGDVAEAVRFASGHGVPLAVRGGGHSVAGHSAVDDAIVIDLSSMKGIDIDPVARVARVQGGVTSGDLAGPASRYGLALTTGDTASVGFGGLATGGGIGFMVRKYGLTIDNLLAARVVTAAGEIVTANEHEHSDLFWAIRGGGGNFGIVTEFVLQLASVPQILGGDLFLPATREVIRGYLEYTASAPDDLTTIASIMHAPPAPFIPEEWVGKLVLSIIACWTGDIESGERALAPLRALATPIADLLRPMPYASIYESTAHQEHRHGVAIRSMFAHELSDDLLDRSLAAMERASSPFSIVHLRGLGGAMARVSRDATAFAHRDARYMFAIIGLWLDPTEDDSAHRAWVNTLWQEVRHEGDGVYVNFVADEGPERVHDAYPPDTYARLAQIKRQYDPDNLFHFNQNISPAQ